ncbi:hypothetical protein [Bremerella alba]|uniref:hypothetical protein n=1 Tax=Bremerella alba TaxID=980252 RepID=UPI001A955D2E|nr:hypothetical protein [Bremerella alba]
MRNKTSAAMLTGNFQAEIFDLNLQLSATRRAGLDEVRDFTHDGISYYLNFGWWLSRDDELDNVPAV